MKYPMMFSLQIILAVLVGFTAKGWADDPKAREIMKLVDARETGDNQRTRMEMLLTDKHGKQRSRSIQSFQKKVGPDTYSLMFFRSPADVKDTAFLSYDYDNPEKDDDQWLYLPALRSTKRIASDGKKGSFMGSDLSYADLTALDLADYDFSLKKDRDVRGHKVWVVEAIPCRSRVVEETGYTKSILFIRQDIHFVVRSIHWLEEGDYIKYVDIKTLQQVDDIWVPMEMLILKRRGKTLIHKTSIQLSDVRFNQDLPDDLFSIRRMEKGL